jgi:hypothetical protein
MERRLLFVCEFQTWRSREQRQNHNFFCITKIGALQIKQDDDYSKAFEEILEMLVDINYEEAATILDEFRVH